MDPDVHQHTQPHADDVVLAKHDGGGVFFIERDGRRIAEMTFVDDGASRARFDHTFVAPELRGQGIARMLLDAAVNWARRSGVRIEPACSYVRTAFARDPTINDVLA